MQKSYILFCIVAISVFASCTEQASKKRSLSPILDPAEYSGYYSTLSGKMEIYWQIHNNTIEIAIKATTIGWIAFGLGEGMLGADVIMGYVVNGQTYIGDFFSSTYAPPELDTDLGGVDNILEYVGAEENGVTILKFVRSLDTLDEFDRPFVVNKTNDCIVAMNTRMDNFFSQHNGGNLAIKLDFQTGGGQETQGDSKEIAHGILMLFGWGVFTVFGIFIARFFKALGKKWFILHIITNVIALALIIIAFIIAIVMVPDDFKQPNKTSRAHSILGLIIVILLGIQILLGTIADRLFKPERTKVPIFPDQIHWWCGRLAQILAFINIYLGIASLDKNSTAWFVIVSLWFGFLIAAYIFLQIKRGVVHEVKK